MLQRSKVLLSFRQISAIPYAASVIVSIISILVLFGWLLELDFLKRIVPGYVFMNPTTAAAFILSSLSLWLAQKKDFKSIRFAQACGCLVALTGLIKLYAIVGFFDIGIDRILFSDHLFDNVTGQINQMAPNTALNFLLLGMALLLINVSEKKGRHFFPSQYLAIAVLLSSFLAIIGYVYGIKSFYVIVSFNPMAIHTAASFFVLTVGLLLSRPEQGLIKEVISNYSGGEMARRLFPLIFILPAVLGWLRLKGEQSGLYSSEMGVALFVVTTSIILGAVVLINARSMNIASVKREQAEADLFMLASIVESTEDGILSRDLEGKVTSWNAGAERIFGYKSKEIIGQSIFVIIPPEYSVEEEQILERIMRGERVEHFETVRAGKGGKHIPVSLTVSPVKDNEDKVIGISKIVRDITKQKQNEKELQYARDAALESARLKSEFLANMSHEIRTPMNGVIGMTELLLKMPLNKEQRDYTEIVQSSADALLRIIDDILDFSKIEAGLLHFEKIDFDLRECVEAPVGLLAERAQVKGIELASLVRTDVPTSLRGDPGRVRQVLMNLIGNAVKFTDKGEVIVTVAIVSETEKHVVLRFEITDTGIGISQDAQRRLFQPFTQADGSTTRKYGGTGLGLAISKHLVERMGGEIGVESVPGKGSTFWFTARFEKQPTKAVPKEAINAVNLEGLRVLIVDDNGTNRKILLHQTASWGMIGAEAGSGAEALKLLREAAQNDSFQVAILDLMMPEMDGLELARAIKADPAISQVRLILLPSYGKRGDGQLAREAGIAAYLQKPVRQSQLYNCLVSAIGEQPVSNIGNSKPLVMRHSLSSDITLKKAAGEKAASKAHILVAEDNLVNQNVALSQLQILGYKITVVSNGREAVETLKKSKYDVVLMDCQMPEMDGFKATAEIRRYEGDAHHTIIIAMTANALEGDREKCLAAGMDDYLSKPVKLETLRRILERWTGSISDKTEAASELLQIVSEENAPKSVDLSVIESYRELQQPGQPDLVEKLINLFIEDIIARLSKLQQAAASEDAATIKSEAHNAKGGAGNIGALRMAEICRELEQKASETNEAHILISRLENEFKQVIEILSSVKQPEDG